MAAVPDASPISRLMPPHPEHGYNAAMELLSGPTPPTGLIIGSSQLALGVLRACQESGRRVPEDISLISYDDPDWHSLWGTGLTTIKLPIRDMAQFAAQSICHGAAPRPPVALQSEAMENGTIYSFPVKLLERGSCRRLLDSAP